MLIKTDIAKSAMTRTEAISAIKTKFVTDSFFMFMSIFLMGICGFLFNFIVITKYNAGVLGTFNLMFAIYNIFILTASGGVPFSVLKHTAEFAGGGHEK